MINFPKRMRSWYALQIELVRLCYALDTHSLATLLFTLRSQQLSTVQPQAIIGVVAKITLRTLCATHLVRSKYCLRTYDL